MAKQKGTETVDTLEQEVIAFAEQVGRLVGTVQVKAEGWLDRDALNAEITRVRDGATALLERLAAMKPSRTEQVMNTAHGNTGRSGGVVDAPGKKHRKPTPNVAISRSRSAAADASRLAKLKAVQGNRRRGR